MACPLPPDQLRNLNLFINVLKKNPNFLHHPDLKVFKEYIESLGGVIPPKTSGGDTPTKPSTKEEPEVDESESEESEVELDFEGCIEPDNDPPQTMGYSTSTATPEEIEKSNAKLREGIELSSEKKYEEAINAFTEAILLNPGVAQLHTKRGQCYLHLKKPNACIRDCSRALEINPDSAAAYKYRGRAHRLLGNFLKAAEDLRNACKIDFDEQADEWLKEVTPNARKLEEHQRKYERKRLEKEVEATRGRIKKMREELKKRTAEMMKNENEGFLGETPGFKLMDFLFSEKDPEIVRALHDPEVEAAFLDSCLNPANIQKYQDNPKVKAVLTKLLKYVKFPPGSTGQVPPGCGESAEVFGTGNGEEAKKAPPSSEIDLD